MNYLYLCLDKIEACVKEKLWSQKIGFLGSKLSRVEKNNIQGIPSIELKQKLQCLLQTKHEKKKKKKNIQAHTLTQKRKVEYLDQFFSAVEKLLESVHEIWIEKNKK